MHFHGLNWSEYEQVISKPGMALEAARQAQAEGLVRYLCFSSHDHTGCGYCMPCPNDVHISENFRYMNWFRV